MDEDVNRTTLSAVDYALNFPGDFEDKREKLLIMYENLDSIIFSMFNSKDYTLLTKVGESIVQFVEGINSMLEFRELADSFLDVGKLLTELDVNNLEDHLKELLMGILDSSLSDLDTWIRTVFVDQSAEDIHYMDVSLIASFFQINTILGNPETKTENEVEFF
jgi:two-component system chemotaxis response regulator CheY